MNLLKTYICNTYKLHLFRTYSFCKTPKLHSDPTIHFCPDNINLQVSSSLTLHRCTWPSFIFHKNRPRSCLTTLPNKTSKQLSYFNKITVEQLQTLHHLPVDFGTISKCSRQRSPQKQTPLI
jgi:hypothetical protein